MLFLINKLFASKPIPYVIYYWHLERLLTTFPLFHFYLFSDYIYYTLSLHFILFIIVNKILKYVLIFYDRLSTRHDFCFIYLLSFSFSLLALIYILIIWIFVYCIIIPSIIT